MERHGGGAGYPPREGTRVFFSQLVNEAMAFAAVAHREQVRKNPKTRIPYIQHAAMVGFILQRAGFDEEVVAAGILHDVLEDTATTRTELRRRFGRRIAELVGSVSEKDKSLPWETRKALALQRLSRASEASLAIAAADKIHNIACITDALEGGVAIWEVFKRGREQQLARFSSFLELLQGSWTHPLVEELAEALERLKRLA
jgi:(p)ppGpp synthase/HD superfamily hydrolase